MTLIELLVILVPLVFAIVGGYIGSQIYGFWGGLGGAILGIFTFVFFFLTLGFLEHIKDTIYPPRPRCESGRCRWDDYKIIECKDNNLTHLRCKCGHLYIHKGNRFMKVKEGCPLPFMMRNVKKRWVIDLETSGQDIPDQGS